MWETTCGSAIIGDDSLKAVLREVNEEISAILFPKNGNILFRLKRQHFDFPDFVDVWLFKEEVDMTEVIYQPEEVCGAKWATPNQIQSMIESGEFVDTFTYLGDLFKTV